MTITHAPDPSYLIYIVWAAWPALSGIVTGRFIGRWLARQLIRRLTRNR